MQIRWPNLRSPDSTRFRSNHLIPNLGKNACPTEAPNTVSKKVIKDDGDVLGMVIWRGSLPEQLREVPLRALHHCVSLVQWKLQVPLGDLGYQ